MNREEMVAAMERAIESPKLPLFASLTAGLVHAGFKIVPKDLWYDLSKALSSEDCLSFLKAATRPSNHDVALVHGFGLFENHCRTMSHEEWQSDVLHDCQDDVANCWAIPVDELICLDYGDQFACDFVSITRLIFAGTESELRAAVAELVGARRLGAESIGRFQ